MIVISFLRESILYQKFCFELICCQFVVCQVKIHYLQFCTCLIRIRMLFGVSVDDVSLAILVKAIDDTVSNRFVKESV